MTIKLNNFFEKIYCINLDKRLDRWLKSQEEFKKHGIDNVERFSATDGIKIPVGSYPQRMSPGDIGSYITHLRIFSDAINKKYKNFLLLEDDVEFKNNFEQEFDIACKEIPSNWEIIHFGGNHVFGQPVKFSEHISIPTRTLATHAIAFNQTCYEKILDLLNDTQPNDVIYSYNYYKFNSYEFTPPLAWQKAGWSDVINGYTDYEFLRNQ
jgi:GR25 family glycosyltransferase involved in LPS biosynthesis